MLVVLHGCAEEISRCGDDQVFTFIDDHHFGLNAFLQRNVTNGLGDFLKERRNRAHQEVPGAGSSRRPAINTQQL